MTTMTTRFAAVALAALALAGCAPSATVSPTGQPAATTAAAAPAAERVVRPRAERNRDDAVGKQVSGRLGQADKAAFRGVSVLVWDKAVLLTGAVAKPEQRRRAEQLAKVPEEVAVVFDEIVLADDPDSATFVPDRAREQRIYAGLLGQDDIGGAYEVRVVNGVAYLLGTTRSAEDAARALAFVRDAEGVKWVVSHVAVK
jgi:hyperosmotically inducible periplasmic protein